MKNTKKLMLSLVSMLLVAALTIAGTVNIVSAAAPGADSTTDPATDSATDSETDPEPLGVPIGDITWYGTDGFNIPLKKVWVRAYVKNVGTAPGFIFIRGYTKTASQSTWRQVYFGLALFLVQQERTIYYSFYVPTWDIANYAKITVGHTLFIPDDTATWQINDP